MSPPRRSPPGFADADGAADAEAIAEADADVLGAEAEVTGALALAAGPSPLLDLSQARNDIAAIGTTKTRDLVRMARELLTPRKTIKARADT